MSNFFKLFIISSILVWPILLFAYKKLGIAWDFPYKHVSKTHKILEFIMLIIPLVGIAATIILHNAYLVSVGVFLYLLLLTALRAFMEWKYDKSSKRYVLNLIALIYGVIITAGAFLFLPMWQL